MISQILVIKNKNWKKKKEKWSEIKQEEMSPTLFKRRRRDRTMDLPWWNTSNV